MVRVSWLCVALALCAGAADAATAYKAPRNALGQPDLQGIWTNSSLTFLQRPPIFKALVATDKDQATILGGFMKMAGDLLKPTADPTAPAPAVVDEAPQADILEMDFHLARIRGEMRTSWIVDPADGRIPFTDAGRAARKASVAENFDGPEGRPMTERCLVAISSPESPPMMNAGFNANYLVTQTRDAVAIEVEMNHDVRIVRLSDRIHPSPSVRRWMGDSVGWFEGDTLVVETTNFDTRGQVNSLGGGFTYGPNTKVTERFTRIGPADMLYEFRVEDPAYYKQPWRGEMPMRAAKGPIYEYACHEGNYSLPNALSGARAEERSPPRVKAAP